MNRRNIASDVDELMAAALKLSQFPHFIIQGVAKGDRNM
jgi:hypothetical protein